LVGVRVGTGVRALKAVTRSKEGFHDWTIRRKEEEEMVLVDAISVGAATMREARQCGSESVAKGKGGGEAAAVQVWASPWIWGFGFGLWGLTVAHAWGLGRGRRPDYRSGDAFLRGGCGLFFLIIEKDADSVMG
jgi:hypothetical protein